MVAAPDCDSRGAGVKNVHLVRGLTGSGEPIELPCVVDQQQCGEVYYITWTRQSQQQPSASNSSAGHQLPWTRVYLYTGASDSAPHKPIGDLLNRSTFVMPDARNPAESSAPTAKLVIEEPRLSDDALYKCDVTYVRGKCPSISLVRVQMLSLPEKAQVLVPSAGSQPQPTSDGQLIGPYSENDQLRLVCLVFGGRPAPRSIIWRKIDASGRTVNLQPASVPSSGSPVEVQLNHTLSSADLGAKFECHVDHEAIERLAPAARVLEPSPPRTEETGDSTSGRLTVGESAGEPTVQSRFRSLDSHVLIDLNVGVASLDLFMSKVNKLTQSSLGFDLGSPMTTSASATQQQQQQSQQQFREGDLVELECVAYNSRPPANVSWFNGQEQIGAGDSSPSGAASGTAGNSRLRHRRLLQRQQVHQNQDGHTFNTHSFLSIKLSRHEHRAQITCQAENGAMRQPASKSIELQVLHAPIALMEPAAGVTVSEAEPGASQQSEVSVYCIYTANPTELAANSTRWYRDGHLLSVERKSGEVAAPEAGQRRRSPASRYLESSTATGYPVLTIRQVNRRDAGLYECQLANAVGTSERLSASDSLRLEVNFRPSVELRAYRAKSAAADELAELDSERELILAGSSVLLVCEVLEARPSKILKFHWFKIAADKQQLVGQSETNRFALSSLAADFKPTTFGCAASNALGQSEISNQLELQLSYAPGPSRVLPVRDPDRRRAILASGGQLSPAAPQPADTPSKSWVAAGGESVLECATAAAGRPRASSWSWRLDGRALRSAADDRTSGADLMQADNPITGQDLSPADTKRDVAADDNNDNDQRPPRPKPIASGRYLYIPRAQLVHKGNYSCVAHSLAGAGPEGPAHELAVSLAPSLVRALAPLSVWPERQSAAPESPQLELVCRVQCEPECRLDWSRDNRPLDGQELAYKVEQSIIEEEPASNTFRGLQSRLLLRLPEARVRELSGSNFTCQSGATSAGPAVKSTTRFTVQYAPEGVHIRAPGDKLNPVEGSNGPTLSCEASAEPRPHFRWLLLAPNASESALQPDAPPPPGLDLTHLAAEQVGVAGGSVSTLDLSGRSVERRESGHYVCEASNALGSGRRSVYVDVLYKPICATLHLHSLDVTAAPSAAELDHSLRDKPRPLKATPGDEYAIVRETSDDFVGLRRILVLAPLARGAKSIAAQQAEVGAPDAISFKDSIFGTLLEEKTRELTGEHRGNIMMSVDGETGNQDSLGFVVRSSADAWERFNALLLNFINNYMSQVRNAVEDVGSMAQNTRGKRQNRHDQDAANLQVNRLDDEMDSGEANSWRSVTKNLITFACMAQDGNPMTNLTFDWTFGRTHLPETDEKPATGEANSPEDPDQKPTLIYTNQNSTLSIMLVRRLDTKSALSPFQLSLLTLNVVVVDSSSAGRKPASYRVTRQTGGQPNVARAPMVRSRDHQARGSLAGAAGLQFDFESRPHDSAHNQIELSADNWSELLGPLLKCQVSNSVGSLDACPVRVNSAERARSRSSLSEFARWRMPSLAQKSLLIASVSVGCALIIFATFGLLLSPYLRTLHQARKADSDGMSSGKADSNTGQSSSSQKSSVLGLLGNGDSSLQGSSDDDSSAKLNGHHHSLASTTTDQLRRQVPLRLSLNQMTAYDQPRGVNDRFRHHTISTKPEARAVNERLVDGVTFDGQQFEVTTTSQDVAGGPRATPHSITSGSKLLSNLRSLSRFKIDRVSDLAKGENVSRNLHMKTTSGSETNTTGLSVTGLESGDLHENGPVSPLTQLQALSSLDSPSQFVRPSDHRQSHLGISRLQPPQATSYYMFDRETPSNINQVTYSNMTEQQPHQLRPYNAMDEFMRQRGIETSYDQPSGHPSFYGSQTFGVAHPQTLDNRLTSQSYLRESLYQHPPPPPSKPPIYPREHQMIPTASGSYRAVNGGISAARPPVAARSIGQQRQFIRDRQVMQSSSLCQAIDNRFSLPLPHYNIDGSFSPNPQQIPLPTVGQFLHQHHDTIDSHLNRMAIERVAFQTDGTEAAPQHQLTYANANFAHGRNYNDDMNTFVSNGSRSHLNSSSASEHIYDLNAYATPEQTPVRSANRLVNQAMANNAIRHLEHMNNRDAQSTSESDRPRVSQLIQTFDTKVPEL